MPLQYDLWQREELFEGSALFFLHERLTRYKKKCIIGDKEARGATEGA